MKNKKSLFAVIGMAFAMLLSSCNLLPQLPTRSNHSSSFDDVSSHINENSSSENNRSSNSKSSSSNHEHVFSEWVVNREPTCTEQGKKVRTCSTCRYADSQPIPALGHDWKTIETMQEATCAQDGLARMICNRCGKDETNIIPAFGHDYKLIDYSIAPVGYADTKVYACSNCNDAFLSFNVNQVTDASKSHLYYEDNGQGEVGAKFLGRPIGNDVELYESDGGVYAYQDAHEPVFNENQLGDYFEFSFALTDQQAALLSNCRLYCDALSAPYLGGMDFWARRQGDEDWTPGFYISGERKGELITDYRYCLYVDDALQYFDPNIKVPVNGRGPEGERLEYVMPYDFHLHSGANKIRLHMAGGYRSTFYNFIFRTHEESPNINGHRWGNEEIIAPIAEGYVGYRKATCLDNDATRLAIRAVEGTLATGSSIKANTLEGFMKLSSNNNSISYKFNYSGAVTKAKIYQYAFMDSFPSNTQRTYASTASGQSVSPSGCNFGINFNNQEVNITEETKAITYGEFFENATEETGIASNSNVGPCYIGEVNLYRGDNTFTYTRYSSYNLSIKDFWIVIE